MTSLSTLANWAAAFVGRDPTLAKTITKGATHDAARS